MASPTRLAPSLCRLTSSGEDGVHKYRTLQIGLFLSLFVGTWFVATQALAGTTIEPNTDRGGSDYADHNLPSPDPALCRKACDQDPKCKAYTYVKPGVQGRLARCYLKDPAPAAKPNNCCVSGVKTATPALQATPSNQPQTQPVQAPTAEPLPVLQLGIVAQGAARQWATEALTRNIISGRGKSSIKHRGLISFGSDLQFSMANPNLSSITVSVSCFGPDGNRVNVKGTNVDREVTLAPNGVNVHQMAVDSGQAFWCRAHSNSPFLFSAWRLVKEDFQHSGGGFIRKRWQAPIRTFVLVK